MNGKVRWLNFLTPGFDGIDERRGDYSGSVQDLCKLIVLVLQKRGVKEFVFCGFSGGSINAPILYLLYPQLMVGEINLAGQGYTWPIGMVLNYSLIINGSGFGMGPQGLP
jgi:hypothetical protein